MDLCRWGKKTKENFLRSRKKTFLTRNPLDLLLVRGVRGVRLMNLENNNLDDGHEERNSFAPDFSRLGTSMVMNLNDYPFLH